MGTGALVAIDLLTTFLKAAMRASEILQKAQAENRDVTDDEVRALVADTDKLRDQFGK